MFPVWIPAIYKGPGVETLPNFLQRPTMAGLVRPPPPMYSSMYEVAYQPQAVFDERLRAMQTENNILRCNIEYMQHRNSTDLAEYEYAWAEQQARLRAAEHRAACTPLLPPNCLLAFAHASVPAGDPRQFSRGMRPDGMRMPDRMWLQEGLHAERAYLERLAGGLHTDQIVLREALQRVHDQNAMFYKPRASPAGPPPRAEAPKTIQAWLNGVDVSFLFMLHAPSCVLTAYLQGTAGEAVDIPRSPRGSFYSATSDIEHVSSSFRATTPTPRPTPAFASFTTSSSKSSQQSSANAPPSSAAPDAYSTRSFSQSTVYTGSFTHTSWSEGAASFSSSANGGPPSTAASLCVDPPWTLRPVTSWEVDYPNREFLPASLWERDVSDAGSSTSGNSGATVIVRE
ncbi:hypothetical protein B0H10DRAFT_721519 [Mycena sp. CBHHK59/15]|nr:hypothetical protein B0H10DRAFT_721519 [Mycena sp. CBHHK59/15]